MTKERLRFPPDAVRKFLRSAPARVIGTRLLVSVALITIILGANVVPNETRLIRLVVVYVAAVGILVAVARQLDQRRVRVIAAALDVLAISILIGITGGGESPWVLLYVFPIMSVSRSLGARWSGAVAILASFGYWWARTVRADDATSTLPFVYITLILCGVAYNSARLANARELALKRISRTVEDIYSQILAERALPEVMRSILATALRLTRADVISLALLDGDEISHFFHASTNVLGKAQGEVEDLIRKHYRTVTAANRGPLLLLKQSWLAPWLRKVGVAEPPWTGRLIKLALPDAPPFGVLGVLSYRSVSPAPADLERLAGLTPLIAVAQQHARTSRAIAARGEENSARLKMLHEINGQLQTDQGLDILFQRVVESVLERVDCEETSLFLPEEGSSRLRKAAVAGPGPEITNALREIEPYEDPASLTGRVYTNRASFLTNSIARNEPNAPVYSAALPSKTTVHYMGAPLRIGDDVLGVIRVLNKKSKHYDYRAGVADLSPTGFSTDELNLLEIIATQVASAIRNAMFIEKKRHFETLIYKSPDPIIVIDRHGQIQHFNEECEKIWGLAENEVIGRDVGDFYESRQHAREINSALWSSDDHAIRAYPARLRARGAVVPIRLSANLLFDKSDRLVSSIGVFKDATKMIQAEEERTRAARLATLGRLAQTTGHDMKHDFGAIFNFLDVLRPMMSSDPVMSEIWKGIETSTTDANNKLRNLLMTARADPPENTLVSLNALIRTFADSVDYQATLANIEFAPDLPATEPVVLVDPEQIRQVLMNLFGNSVDAINARRKGREIRGHISLTVESGAAEVRLTWCDDGIGIADEDRDQVFTAFFTKKESGSGLGMYITKSIIEAHGGAIRISRARAPGVCFELSLPLFRDTLVDPVEVRA